MQSILKPKYLLSLIKARLSSLDKTSQDGNKTQNLDLCPHSKSLSQQILPNQLGQKPRILILMQILERTLMQVVIIRIQVIQTVKLLILKSQMMKVEEVVLVLLSLFYFYSLLVQVELIGTSTLERTKMMKMALFGISRTLPWNKMLMKVLTINKVLTE